MKYSNQTLSDINKRYADIRRNIQLTNLKSKGIQAILIDKQISPDLLDTRNTNDIENDEFARKAILNEYSNKLLPTGQVYEFQQKLKDNNLEKFFIKNYPKIEKETKMYRKLDPLTLYNITKRLRNIESQELDLLDDKNDRVSQFTDIESLLKTIENNLQTLTELAIDPTQKKDYFDKLQKVDAIIQSMGMINDNIVFMQDLFKLQYPNVVQNLSTIVQSTTPPINDPNAKLPSNPDPTGLLNLVSPASLTSAVNSNQVVQTTNPQLKKQTVNLNTDITSYTEQDYEILKNFVYENSITKTNMAKILSNVLQNNYSSEDIKNWGNKEEMYNEFMKRKDGVIASLSIQTTQKEKANKKAQEQEAKSKKRIKDDEQQRLNEQINDLNLRIQAIDASIKDLEKILINVQNTNDRRILQENGQLLKNYDMKIKLNDTSAKLKNAMILTIPIKIKALEKEQQQLENQLQSLQNP